MTFFLACFKHEHIIYFPSPKPNICENALSFNHSAPKGGWRALRLLRPSVTAPTKHQSMDGKAQSALMCAQVSPQCQSAMQPLTSLRSSEAFLNLPF